MYICIRIYNIHIHVYIGLCIGLCFCEGCDVLQWVAVCCIVLQYLAVSCSVLQFAAVSCSVGRSLLLWGLAVSCRYAATHCNSLQQCSTVHHITTHSNTLQHLSTHCNTLHLNTAMLVYGGSSELQVCCRCVVGVRQCVAVCCSVLQRTATRYSYAGVWG